MALNKTKIILKGEQVLTIHDAPYENDAFRYACNYSNWIKTILNKELNKKVSHATKIIRSKTIT